MVTAAVREAGVDFVVIGSLERRDFDPAHLETVREAGEIVLSEDGAEILRFDRPE
jgi:hypothetical protein